MGYETNSPVKQVWLPMDYQFIDNHAGSFKDFADAYKEKYGIDLRSFLKLIKIDNDYSVIITENVLLSSYRAGDGFYPTKGMHLVKSNAIAGISTMLQFAPGDQLIAFTISDSNNQQGFGFEIVFGDEAPATIDDLAVVLYEI